MPSHAEEQSVFRTVVGTCVLGAGIVTIASILLIAPFITFSPLLSTFIVVGQGVSGVVAIVVGVRTSRVGEL